MIINPLSEGVTHIVSEFHELEWQGSRFIPAFFISVVLTITLILISLLWPYGLLAVIEDMMRMLMRDTIAKMKGESLAVNMGYTITLGFFFFIWLPFALLCLPVYILGGIGKLFLNS